MRANLIEDSALLRIEIPVDLCDDHGCFHEVVEVAVLRGDERPNLVRIDVYDAREPIGDDPVALQREARQVPQQQRLVAPNRLWLTDITEHRTAEGKLYLCAVKDVFSNRIVSYSIDSRMKSRLAVDAIENAVARRGEVAACIVHSDRGSQGEFNRSSQHLDCGGVRWAEVVRRLGRCADGQSSHAVAGAARAPS